jgi:hypothetical protein
MRYKKAWWLVMLVAVGLAVGILPAAGQEINTTDKFDSYVNGHGALDQTEAEAVGYIFESPWKLVEEGEFFGETLNVVPFQSSDQAVYFGYVNPNTGRGTYEGAPASDPLFKTPIQTLSQTCDYLTASWWYYRQVEQYAQPGYDKTTVTLKFYSDAVGTTVVASEDLFDYDCTDASVDSWLQELHTEEVPDGATHAQLWFSFEPKDSFNNDFFGWIIDNVLLQCSEDVPELKWKDDTPVNLPQGVEGEKYCFGEEEEPEPPLLPGPNFGYDLMEWIEGDGEVRFSLARECPRPPCECDNCVKLMEGDPYPLPERMDLSSEGILSGTIEAGNAGNYEFWVMVEKGLKDSPREYQCICHKFTIAVRSTGDTCFYDDFETDKGWTPVWDDVYELPDCVNLWKTTKDPEWVPNTPDLTGYGTVAAFSIDSTDADCGEDNTYDTGKRVKGCFVSPEFGPCVEGEITVGFKSWRDVENYPSGAFDKTWVEVSKDGGETWKQVKDEDYPDNDLYWDSKDTAGQNVWTWEEAATGVYVDGTETDIQVRFCFDSVDGYGNDYPGWFIDEVTVRVIKSDPYCTFGCPLPDGYVNEPYEKQVLTYEGGVVDRISVTGALPDGLEVVSHTSSPTTWHIEGKPRKTGTFDFTVNLEQDIGGGKFKLAGSCVCQITINEQRCHFFEDFEGDPVWSWSGLWGRRVKADLPDSPVDVEGIEIGAGNHVAYYGSAPSTPNDYDTGDRTTGVLTLIALPEGIPIKPEVEYIELSFDSFRNVEQFSDGYDVTKVQIRWDTGPEWITVWYKDSGDLNSTEWTTEFANDGCAFEKDPDATKMWIRFAFDSVDKLYNSYFGWMVDNIKVCWSDTGCPIDPNLETKSLLTRGTNELSVMNVPNPIKDVHTTTFTVRGVGIEAIKIQIFDLSGALVFERETEGNEMVWHTDSDYGEYLANGVYLYRAFAKMGGTWVETKFQKLVIER